jgi:hypothetical protein
MRKNEGDVSYNLRFPADVYALLKQLQISETVRLNRMVSLNEIILKAVKDKAKTTTSKRALSLDEADDDSDRDC